jgi:hypothetical protein
MSDNYNPYQTPAAAPTDAAPQAQPGALFFTVGAPKLITMSICTFGLYHIYWFYRNWILIQKRSTTPMMPLPRSIFSLIFCYACFRQIELAEKAANIRSPLNATAAAILYILFQFSARLPDPAGAIVFLAFLPIMMANKSATVVNQVSCGLSCDNTALRGWNWVAVGVGGPGFALAMAGLLLGAGK